MVIWELSATGEARQQQALPLIGVAFAMLSVCLLIQSTWGSPSATTRAASKIVPVLLQWPNSERRAMKVRLRRFPRGGSVAAVMSAAARQTRADPG